MHLSTLARQRALLPILLFASTVYSREELIFTSSVTYCEPPETLLVQRLDVVYFASNQSVFFNISAASVEPNVNVTANVFLNVYGLHPVNYTINLCDILDGALCPLPMYNFTGADTLSLPTSLGIAGKIPETVFKIPDLEGFAQLTLSEVGTGNVKACVQATLSNGWSAHQPPVEWVTGAFATVALLSAIWQSWSPEAISPFILIDLLHLYQTIATTALLNLNYPSVYRAYALNFAWAMGFFPSTRIQDSINNMRHLTGGTLADSNTGSAVSLVNRKYSPYNTVANLVVQAASPALGLIKTLAKPMLFSSGSPTFQVLADQGAVQTVTTDSSNVLQAGVPIYVNLLHIGTANAFMTVFLTVLILSALAMSSLGLIYVILLAFTKGRSPRKTNLWKELLENYPGYFRAWALRLGLIILIPSLNFIFYQWTLNDSWLSVLLSVFTLVAILGLVGYPMISTLRAAYIFSPEWIYSSKDVIDLHGPLYARYRVPRFHFFVPDILALTLKAIFVAFAKGSGVAQIAGIISIEGISMLLSSFLRPFRSRRENIFSIFFAIVRLVGSGLLIAFLENLNVDAIKRVVIGFIIIVLFSVAVLVMFARVIIELLSCKIGSTILTNTTSFSPRTLQDSDSGMMEKNGTKSSSSWDPELAADRPINPTPDHGSPHDRGFLQPHDFSTITSPATSTTPDTSRDSGTMTFGSILSRRWSFSLSAPGSPASSSALHQSGLRTMSELSSSPHSPVTPISHGTDGQTEPQHENSSH